MQKNPTVRRPGLRHSMAKPRTTYRRTIVFVTHKIRVDPVILGGWHIGLHIKHARLRHGHSVTGRYWPRTPTTL